MCHVNNLLHLNIKKSQKIKKNNFNSEVRRNILSLDTKLQVDQTQKKIVTKVQKALVYLKDN